MKNVTFLISLLIFSPFFLPAQNVGINIQTPVFDLDVRSLSSTTDAQLNLGALGNAHYLRISSGQDGGFSSPVISWKAGDSLSLGSDQGGYTELFKLKTDGTLKLNSLQGIGLDARDMPLITRGWDPFTSGQYAGLGRWGLFMEPNNLIIGIPDIANRGIKFVQYGAGSLIAAEMMTLQEGDLTLLGALRLGSPQGIALSAGLMRWTGVDFEGYDGTQWKSLTGTGMSHTLIISASAFHAADSDNHWVQNSGQGGTYIDDGTGSGSKMVASIPLPVGATITSMTVYFLDNASENLDIGVKAEYMLSGFFSSTPFQITTAGMSSSWQSLTINGSFTLVDDTGYFIEAEESNGSLWGPDLAVKGVRLVYTTPGG